MIRYCIINTTDLGSVDVLDPSLDCEVIPEYRRPAYLYDNLGSAEQELIRLKAAYPNQDFYLFQSVAVARMRDTDPKTIIAEEL
jgi:hypothetical protein